MNNGNAVTTEKPYRWVILIVLTMAMFIVNVMQFQIAGLADR